MKKIFLLISPLLFLVACSSGGDGGGNSIATSTPTIYGCMDPCAVNYNASATSDVGQVCLYSFLGTYTVSDYRLDGVSLYSNVWQNPLVGGAITFGQGTYTTYFIYADGQELSSSGTFENNATQLLLYPFSSPAELWTMTKINCLEFDGQSIVDGVLHEIELDYYSGKLDNLERVPTDLKFDVTQFKRKK